MRRAKRLATLLWFVLLCILLVGCGQRPVLMEVISEKIDVVEAPFPLGYPSTNPQKNRIIATLRRGERFYLRGEVVEKDYGYYEIDLLSGKRGYVIGDSRLSPMFQKPK